MLLVGECLTMATPARAGAVLLDGDRITAVGDPAELRARAPGVRVVRAERVTPGVHDAHAHPSLWGRALEELDLTGLSDPRDVADRVARRARELPPGAWVRGRGYLFDARPDAGLLDRAAPDHPVLVESRDIHSAWANRAALRLAGIDRETPDPAAGRLLRDAAGEPDGYLLERAVEMVARAVPALGQADLERGLADLAGRGYTAVHAMAYAGSDELPWLESLAGAGRLPLRVWLALARGRWRGVAPGWRGGDFDVAAVKLFADGALGSRTAWMHEPYPDGSTGMPLDDADTLRAEGGDALAAGYTLAVHAIGTRAVATVTELVRELAPAACRPLRVEHLQHLRDAELHALRGLPVTASMQPIHLLEDAALVRRHLPGREREAFRFQDLADAGLTLAFGSDAPVARPEVEAGIGAATSHLLDPGQSLTEAEALRAFTAGAAAAAGWSDCGLLVPGARADLALWERGRVVARVWRGELQAVAAR